MNGDQPQQPDPRQDSPWQYQPTSPSAQTQPQIPPAPVTDYAQPYAEQAAPLSPAEVTWSASEFVAHDKSSSWYGLFALAVIVVLAVVFLITRDIFSVVIIGALAVLVGVTASRKPRVVAYKVDDHGVTIGGKFRPYADYRSFAVVQEGAFSSVTFAPLKRFMVPFSIYYDPKDEDDIVDVIAMHLPFEQRDHDVMDRIARNMRF